MEMIEPRQTWRDLLGEIISNPYERQRLAAALKVNPTTLGRWVANKTHPRGDNLRQLIDALPNYRQKLAELATQEYPYVPYIPSIAPHKILETERPELIAKISASFYAHAVSTYTANPPITRSSALISLILQQMLKHLNPLQNKVNVTILQCVQPAPGKKVRSLRKRLAFTTGCREPSWNGEIFLGAESQIGQAVISGHPVVIQTFQEKQLYYPGQETLGIESSLAYPILFSGCVAGCVTVNSEQVGYFTQKYVDVTQRYAELLTLAFEEHEFYNLHEITLQVMPSRHLQQLYIGDIQYRINDKRRRAKLAATQMSRVQAEQEVYQEIEEFLLHV
jgi:hypothetical protein